MQLEQRNQSGTILAVDYGIRVELKLHYPFVGKLAISKCRNVIHCFPRKSARSHNYHLKSAFGERISGHAKLLSDLP